MRGGQGGPDPRNNFFSMLKHKNVVKMEAPAADKSSL